MFKSKSSFTTRQDSFFFWKSDESIVAMKCGNAHGAKGFTKFGPQTLNPAVDTTATEPGLRGHQ
jgi:hypothetical protein